MTPTTRPAPSRRPLALLAAGTLLALAACSGEPQPLTLTAGGEDALASCLPFDVGTLAGMEPAFAGTVIELTDSVAILEVDRWYTDGDAEAVHIEYTPGYEALIGTPSFEVGQRYLITAADGVVNGCGYSGLATPEYESAFEEAFAG